MLFVYLISSVLELFIDFMLFIIIENKIGFIIVFCGMFLFMGKNLVLFL